MNSARSATAQHGKHPSPAMSAKWRTLGRVPREVGIFLALGVVLSLSSKLLQFVPLLKDRAWLGNVIVLPAAAFLVLAALFALPPYRELYVSDAGRAWALAAAACIGIVSFQLLMMRLVGGNQ